MQMLKLSMGEQHTLQEYTARVQQWGWRVVLREEAAGAGQPLHMLTHVPEVFQAQLNATELKVRAAFTRIGTLQTSPCTM